MEQIRVGTITILIDGIQYALSGDFTLNPGVDKREEVVGPDRSFGTKITPQAAFVEGNVRDTNGLDVKSLLGLSGVTVTCELANGKTWVLPDAVNTSEGDISVMEGEIPIRFAAATADEMTPSPA